MAAPQKGRVGMRYLGDDRYPLAFVWLAAWAVRDWTVRRRAKAAR
jgi:hypothetical protein